MSIFISYSRADSDFVDLIQRLLVSKGYDAWLDRRNIGIGSRWDDAIETAIQSRDFMIVVLSPEAVDSQNVSDEWSYAIDEGKTIIPVYYRTCSIPMRLRRLQGINFESQPFASAFKALTEALGEPDNRPLDPLELAKRQGFILVEVKYPLDIEKIRVAYVYSDYPLVQSFLNILYVTLMQARVKRHTYGEDWFVRDKLTGQEFKRPEGAEISRLLLHEVGIEPGAQLEIILRKGLIDDITNNIKRT